MGVLAFWGIRVPLPMEGGRWAPGEGREECAGPPDVYFPTSQEGGTRSPTCLSARPEAVSRNAGVRALLLEVERGKDNAQRLYEKSGFVEHSRYLLMQLLA